MVADALRAEPLIDAFADALWLEDGLSQNTLSAYRRDLQALADWFQISPATSETRNLHTAESLLGDILSKLPLDGDGMDPELLRAGWLKAAGPFLGQQSNLLSIVKGVATIQVLQPAMRYHLQQWQGALLGKLKDQFGKDAVHSIRIRIG